MDEKAARSLFCLVALCLSPTQEDADFLRSLGRILQVPEHAQAGAITMLNLVHEEDGDASNVDGDDGDGDGGTHTWRAARRAERWGAQVRASLPSKQFALEGYATLFLMCLQGPQRLLQQDQQNTSMFNNKSKKSKKNCFTKREAQELCRNVRFNAKTSVILRRLAFLLRIKLSTVAALEEIAIFKMEQQMQSVAMQKTKGTHDSDANNGGGDDSESEEVFSKRKQRRKGVVRGLKIGGAAAAAGGLLAITGGLAAPALAVGLTHIGLGAAATFTTTASVAAFLGASGAGLTGYKMSRRTKGCKHFEFHLINNGFSPRVGDNQTEVIDEEDSNENREGAIKGMTVYICVSGYLRQAGPTTKKPNKMEFPSPSLPPPSNGRQEERLSKSIFKSKAAERLLAPKTSAANSPEFFSPWGAQPPHMFPDQVLDRFYAVVAPERRGLASGLLQHYKKKFKNESKQKNLKMIEENAATVDSNNAPSIAIAEDGAGDDNDDFIDYLLGGNHDTAVDELYASLERHYKVHPLKIKSCQRESFTDEASIPYHLLINIGEERLEAMLAGERDFKNSSDANWDRLSHLMDNQRPWNVELSFEEDAKASAESKEGTALDTTVSSTATESYCNETDEKNSTASIDQISLPGELSTEQGRDEYNEKVMNIIEDLKFRFDEMEGNEPPQNIVDSMAPMSVSLEEELRRLKITVSDEEDEKVQKKTKKLLKKNKKGSRKSHYENEVYWWRESVARFGDQYTLIWEPETLLEIGSCVESLIRESTTKGALGALQFTALAPVILTVALPLAITGVISFLDNIWSIACRAADEAGELLADALLSGAHGDRPVVLIGFSVGGRVVASCLSALEKVANAHINESGEEEGSHSKVHDVNEKLRKYSQLIKTSKARQRRASTIVRDAVIIGAPLDTSEKRWTKRRNVVNGRLINVYNPKDWVLALLYRYKSWSVVSLSGLQPVFSAPAPGTSPVENYNVSEIVGGHSEYHANIREILHTVGVGDIHGETSHSQYFARGIATKSKK